MNTTETITEYILLDEKGQPHYKDGKLLKIPLRRLQLLSKTKCLDFNGTEVDGKNGEVYKLASLDAFTAMILGE